MIVTIILDGDGDNVGRFNGWVGVPRALIQRRHQFATDLFQKGEVGGRQAAERLRDRVIQHVSASRNISLDHVHVNQSLVFWCVVALPEVRSSELNFLFSNATGLARFLGIGLSAFTRGFNSTAYAMLMVDAGTQPQAANEAIKSAYSIGFQR